MPLILPQACCWRENCQLSGAAIHCPIAYTDRLPASTAASANPARIVPALPLSQPCQRLAECAGQPGRVGEISQQPGTGVSPQDKVSNRRAVTRFSKLY